MWHLRRYRADIAHSSICRLAVRPARVAEQKRPMSRSWRHRRDEWVSSLESGGTWTRWQGFCRTEGRGKVAAMQLLMPMRRLAWPGSCRCRTSWGMSRRRAVRHPHLDPDAWFVRSAAATRRLWPVNARFECRGFGSVGTAWRCGANAGRSTCLPPLACSPTQKRR